MKKIIFALFAFSIPFATSMALTNEEQITGDKMCYNTFWDNSYWNWLYDDKWLYKCQCKKWFEFDTDMKKCIKWWTIENWNAVCRKNFWPLSYWDWKEWSDEKWYICSCEKWSSWNSDSTKCVEVKTEVIWTWNMSLKESSFIDDRVKEAMWKIHTYMSSYSVTIRNTSLNSMISTFEIKKKENLILSDRILVNKITSGLIDLRDNWDNY